MTRLLVHGIYDQKTLETLKSKVPCDFVFDLRGRSPNLVPFHLLQVLLKSIQSEEVYLTFENDRPETILSFINLLKNEPFKFTLVLRDQQSVDFYQRLGLPYIWMFHPEGDWQGILNTDFCRGVLLPVKWQRHYQNNSTLWNLTQYRNLNVFVHADSFEEASQLDLGPHVNLSLDLTQEIETGHRKVDQDKLKKMNIWSKLHEHSSRQ
ncbi:hypothetical protein [Peredibacter starrii]|uniref:DUF4123 domain-containing protein n=1 Tax=Peredibacter starrii TaxID=28202 RepID=A0AAX4HKP9_9BACT|nr:hypothetical protein [Peredibacter starrii]WPU63740.1 hypothetical protein SOO65_13680 [Peredibacter starrii]